MDFENILYEVKDGILYLTLNRPDVRNALSPAMWRDIQNGVQRAGSDPDVKVVIISGKGGKALASGADIREIHDRAYLKQMEGTATLSLKMVEDLYKPTICAVNGYALGGGCLSAWAFGAVASAGVAGVSPAELVRKNFIPVMAGLIVASIFTACML